MNRNVYFFFKLQSTTLIKANINNTVKVFPKYYVINLIFILLIELRRVESSPAPTYNIEMFKQLIKKNEWQFWRKKTYSFKFFLYQTEEIRIGLKN